MKIMIWRWSKSGELKSAYCCNGCTKIMKKYGYMDRIFTIENNKIVSAIKDDPEISLGYKIKYNL